MLRPWRILLTGHWMNLTFLNNGKRPSSAPRQKLIRRAAQLIIDPFQFFTFSRVWLSASWSGVRTVLYPNYVKFPPPLSLEDQYAFLPTGSTTAAVVVILQNITEMLDGNGHVIIISTDFTKLSANPPKSQLQICLWLRYSHHITEFRFANWPKFHHPLPPDNSGTTPCMRPSPSL